jgi:hypothetical protein
MLSVNRYSQEHIDASRARVDAQISTYRALIRAAKKTKASPLASALDSFEPVFFNNMVLVLDSYFTHRARGMEGKDGNPLNEVRVLCTSMVENDGLMGADKTIKLDPSKSVLGYHVGDEIRVTEADFVRLSGAYFSELEKRYT